jgi:hypothetical protein
VLSRLPLCLSIVYLPNVSEWSGIRLSRIKGTRKAGLYPRDRSGIGQPSRLLYALGCKSSYGLSLRLSKSESASHGLLASKSTLPVLSLAQVPACPDLVCLEDKPLSLPMPAPRHERKSSLRSSYDSSPRPAMSIEVIPAHAGLACKCPQAGTDRRLGRENTGAQTHDGMRKRVLVMWLLGQSLLLARLLASGSSAVLVGVCRLPAPSLDILKHRRPEIGPGTVNICHDDFSEIMSKL